MATFEANRVSVRIDSEKGRPGMLDVRVQGWKWEDVDAARRAMNGDGEDIPESEIRSTADAPHWALRVQATSAMVTRLAEAMAEF